MADKVLRFSTVGPDRYADGSVVVDGECYALVWSPAGKTFSGFNADGTPVSSRDRVVLAGALAQGGKCRELFLVNSHNNLLSAFLLHTMKREGDLLIKPMAGFYYERN